MTCLQQYSFPPFQETTPNPDASKVQPEKDSEDRELAPHSRPSRPVSDFRKYAFSCSFCTVPFLVGQKAVVSASRPRYKTTLCRNWQSTNECMFGEDCIFAHGESELRSETNNETLKLANQLIGAAQVTTSTERLCRETRDRT